VSNSRAKTKKLHCNDSDQFPLLPALQNQTLRRPSPISAENDNPMTNCQHFYPDPSIMLNHLTAGVGDRKQDCFVTFARFLLDNSIDLVTIDERNSRIGEHNRPVLVDSPRISANRTDFHLENGLQN